MILYLFILGKSAFMLQSNKLNQVFQHFYADNEVFFYTKNTMSEYISCNEQVAHALSLSSIKDIAGRNDLCFGWASERVNMLNRHDAVVMQRNLCVTQLEAPFTLPSGKKMQLLSHKAPVYDGEDLVGIAGVSVDILSCQDINNTTLSKFNALLQTQRLNQQDKLCRLLSPREHACANHYLNGKTAKETARLMHISHRTVEQHFTNIKIKLGLRCKRELHNYR